MGEGVVALWLDSRMAWVYANLYVPLLNYAWRGACNRWPPGVWRLSYVCHQCVLQAVCPLGGCMCGYCACTYHGPSSAPSTPARAPPTPPAAFLRTGFHSVTVRWFAVGMALCVTTLLLPIGFPLDSHQQMAAMDMQSPCLHVDAGWAAGWAGRHASLLRQIGGTMPDRHIRCMVHTHTPRTAVASQLILCHCTLELQSRWPSV